MKYYSEILRKTFDTVKELNDAEAAEKERCSRNKKKRPPAQKKSKPQKKRLRRQRKNMRSRSKRAAKLCLVGAQQRGNLLM